MVPVYLVTVAVVLAVGIWLKGDTYVPVPDRATGVIELRHGRRYLTVAITCLLVGPTIVIQAYKSDGPWTSIEVVGFILLLISMVTGPFWMIIDAVRTRVLVSKEQIEEVTPLSGRRSVRWNEIREVRYNLFGQWIRIDGTRGGPVRVHVRLRGFPFLLQRLQSEPGLITRFRGLARLL